MPTLTTIPAVEQEVKQLRMAAYCRVSSNSADQLNSYAAQVRYYTDYIGAHPNWTLIDIYADKLTGTEAETREEFQRMLADCKRGKIDRILVKSVSRFARNTSDCLMAIRLLKSLGVTVFFEKENLDTAHMTDEFVLTMHGMAAQEESLTISSNLRWATRKRMAGGTFLPGHTPYGYRLQNREHVIYEPEAAIVRQIYAWYLSGMGRLAIVNRLRREYPDDDWQDCRINYVLRNEHYIGDALFQKQFNTGSLPYRQLRNHGQLPQYYVEGYNEPIISAEDFQAAQRLIALRKEATPQSVRVDYPLSRKLKCRCGSYFRRRIIHKTANWECRTHNTHSSECGMKPIPEVTIYAAFTAMVNKLASHRAYILTPMIAQLEQMQARHSGTQQKVYELDKQIAELNTQSHTIARLHSKGILDSADFAAQTSRVNQQVSALRSERGRLLREDENNDAIADLRALDDALSAVTETQTAFNESLFADIVQGITAVSLTELQFRLLGGLELTETIQRQERRRTV